MLLSSLAFGDQPNRPSTYLDLGITSVGDDNDRQVSGTRGTYDGNIRVYVLELISSHYRDSDGTNYEMAALDIPFDSVVNFDYQETFSRTLTWHASEGNVSSISQSNIAAIVSVTGPDWQVASSDTVGGTSYFFNAYFSDGCAFAEEGQTGTHDPYPSNTHTVMVEEATWGG
jgi:hypothetical protein